MTKERLSEIRHFAEENFSAGEDVQVTLDAVTPDGESVAISNVWIDRSARFPLTDEGAVKEWGLENVVSFINLIDTYCKRC